MGLASHRTLKSFLLPGGVLLLAAALVLRTGLVQIPASAIDFYYYAAFVSGLLLAWRFRSCRIFCALITLFLAHRAMEFFSSGKIPSNGPGLIAFKAMAVLLPLNFILLSLVRERGLALPAMVNPVVVLFLESVWVAVICRPGATTGPWFLRTARVDPRLTGATRIPQFGLLLYSLALGTMAFRFLMHNKPVDSGFFWSLVATLPGMQASGAGKLGSAYFATAGLILAGSIIENSYLLAYHDELTGLPSRRAFQEALLQLEAPYAIAVVDIDHFKSFNDTYGHDTGDQVLRMVASRLARVSGGGEAYRVGGEEFSILFPDKSMREAASHLESLRAVIARSEFYVRGVIERRKEARGPDRRYTTSKRPRKSADARQRKLPFPERGLSVTVSIGVAEPTARIKEAENVVQAADKALYRAKQGGRNRVETTTTTRKHRSRLRRSTA